MQAFSQISRLWRWISEATGQVLVEYGLLLSLLALAALGSLVAVGTGVGGLNAFFQKAADALEDALASL